MPTRKFGVWIGGISLALSMISFVPSAGPFTPAILLSFVALFGAVIAAAMGVFRLSILTLYVVCATLIAASRSFSGLARVEYLMVVLGVIDFILGLILYANFKRTVSPADHSPG